MMAEGLEEPFPHQAGEADQIDGNATSISAPARRRYAGAVYQRSNPRPGGQVAREAAMLVSFSGVRCHLPTA
jgi:hypothetical protein